MLHHDFRTHPCQEIVAPLATRSVCRTLGSQLQTQRSTPSPTTLYQKTLLPIFWERVAWAFRAIGSGEAWGFCEAGRSGCSFWTSQIVQQRCYSSSTTIKLIVHTYWQCMTRWLKGAKRLWTDIHSTKSAINSTRRLRKRMGGRPRNIKQTLANDIQRGFYKHRL